MVQPVQLLTALPRPAWGYVALVALAAAAGFATGSPAPLLVAAVLALPASLVALPCYYLAYGLLALLPGADPASASGAGSAAADGHTVTAVVTGEPAAWFSVTTAVVGVVLLAAAAVANVVLLQRVQARRRAPAVARG